MHSFYSGRAKKKDMFVNNGLENLTRVVSIVNALMTSFFSPWNKDKITHFILNLIKWLILPIVDDTAAGSLCWRKTYLIINYELIKKNKRGDKFDVSPSSDHCAPTKGGGS